MAKKKPEDTKSILKDIKRKTYRKYSSEEKIRIVEFTFVYISNFK